MALDFNGREPVGFGGRKCVPKIDAEMQLRLSTIKNYGADADKTLAEAFPDDEKYVFKFLQEQMSAFEKQQLHAYLTGGESMLNTIMDEVKNAMNGAIGGGNE